MNYFLLFTLLTTGVVSQLCNTNGCITFTVGQGTGCDWK
jgi:hypothetical protein